MSPEEQALAGAQLTDILKKAVPTGGGSVYVATLFEYPRYVCPSMYAHYVCPSMYSMFVWSLSIGAGDAAAVDAAQPQLVESFKEYKKSFQQALLLFNKKPKKGLTLLQELGFVGTSPQEIARFLSKTQGLNKTMIGEYMGEKEDVPIKVMHAYTDALDFTDMTFDDALRCVVADGAGVADGCRYTCIAHRRFLDGFRLPGEAQKIDRFMLKFAERYTHCNPNAFASANVAYVLAYAVIMLNTDAHNPMVKKKMTKQVRWATSRNVPLFCVPMQSYALCILRTHIGHRPPSLRTFCATAAASTRAATSMRPTCASCTTASSTTRSS